MIKLPEGGGGTHLTFQIFILQMQTDLPEAASIESTKVLILLIES